MKSSIENKASSLLTREENDQVFRLFDFKCQSLSTAIVQLFYTQGPDHLNWVKRDTGVMCFIKDNNRRSYFFRMYCLNRSKLIWEQELYINFVYKCDQNYFHMFEIDECIAGLNFASENEALAMKSVIMEKLAIKKQRREERKSRNSLQNKSTIQPISGPRKPPYNNNSSSNLNLADKYNSPSNNIQNVVKINKKKPPHIKITKDDIGLPVNFVHISHVGWDPNKGFDINVEDPQLKKFFNKAGVSDRQLEDKETRDFIYEFIYTHGGVDAAKSEVLEPSAAAKSPYPPPHAANIQIPPTPPPVPQRTPLNLQRSAPPPPPPIKAKAPPPQVRGTPPPRPDPILSIPEPPAVNSAPPPPLPPPMADFTLNAPPPPPMANQSALPSVGVSSSNSLANNTPDPRSALLESIRGPRNLKPVVEVERKPSVGDSRGDLLSEIRQGIKLNPVQSCQRPSSGPSCTENSMAEALSKALQARAFVIQPDSESDSGNSTDDDDEWDPED